MADPGSSEAQGEAGLKERGNAEFKARNFLKAAALYTQAIKEAPDNHALYSNRSAAFLQLSKLTKALADAEAAIRLNPAWEKGYYRKGCALEAMKRYDEVSRPRLPSPALACPHLPSPALTCPHLFNLEFLSWVLTGLRGCVWWHAVVLCCCLAARWQALEAFREAAERSPGSAETAGKLRLLSKLARDHKRSHPSSTHRMHPPSAAQPFILHDPAVSRSLALLPPVHSHASLIILSPCLCHPLPSLSPTALTSTFIKLFSVCALPLSFTSPSSSTLSSLISPAPASLFARMDRLVMHPALPVTPCLLPPSPPPLLV
ncbi:unnamed protein product [Closterium sp. NIES-54]